MEAAASQNGLGLRDWLPLILADGALVALAAVELRFGYLTGYGSALSLDPLTRLRLGLRSHAATIADPASFAAWVLPPFVVTVALAPLLIRHLAGHAASSSDAGYYARSALAGTAVCLAAAAVATLLGLLSGLPSVTGASPLGTGLATSGRLGPLLSGSAVWVAPIAATLAASAFGVLNGYLVRRRLRSMA
jgi:hypothetical protein